MARDGLRFGLGCGRWGKDWRNGVKPAPACPLGRRVAPAQAGAFVGNRVGLHQGWAARSGAAPDLPVMPKACRIKLANLWFDGRALLAHPRSGLYVVEPSRDRPPSDRSLWGGYELSREFGKLRS